MDPVGSHNNLPIVAVAPDDSVGLGVLLRVLWDNPSMDHTALDRRMDSSVHSYRTVQVHSIGKLCVFA